MSLGTYPDISLKAAGNRRDEARRLLEQGIDPAEQKRRDIHAAQIRASHTFTSVALAYITKNERDGLAANTITKRRWFVRLLQKALGNRPITEIRPFDILDVNRRSNGTDFGAISACKRGPLAARR